MGEFTLRKLYKGLTFTAEIIGILWFLVMFITFLLQVFTRYVMNDPLGWTTELSLIAFLWFAFWSGGLLVRPKDQVRFDLLYQISSEKTRRILALVTTVSLALIFLAGLPANYDYVTFMKIDVTSVLEIRFDYVFAVFIIFMATFAIRHLLRAFRIVRPNWQDEI